MLSKQKIELLQFSLQLPNLIIKILIVSDYKYGIAHQSKLISFYLIVSSDALFIMVRAINED